MMSSIVESPFGNIECLVQLGTRSFMLFLFVNCISELSVKTRGVSNLGMDMWEQRIRYGIPHYGKFQ